MRIFNGKRAANKILKELKEEIKKLKLSPTLGVIMVGKNEESALYIKLKKQTGAKIGIKVEEYNFGSDTNEEEIIGKIQELNKNEEISGIIVQLPLPAVFNTDKIIETINPLKDVDGFHKQNVALLEKGEPNFIPVLPQAILLALTAAKTDLSDKKIVALVNSETFGRTLEIVFKNQGLKLHCWLRRACIVMGIEKEVKEADVLILACGCPNFIKGDMIKEGAILIDAGITRFHNNKVVGDVDRLSVEKKAAYLTPVPGGVGPLTVALLLRNVCLAAKLASFNRA